MQQHALEVVGIWMKSPLAVSMLIDRSSYRAVVVTSDTKPSELEVFTKAPATNRLKVGILSTANVLKNVNLRRLLGHLDRIIVIDSPDMLAKLQARMVNIQYSSRGRWTPIKVDVATLKAHLQVEQDLSVLRGNFKLPTVGPEVTRLTSHHLYRALPKMMTTSPEAEPVEVVAYAQLVCRHAAGLAKAGDVRSATKTIVAHGGNPTITPRLLHYLKKHKDLLKRAFILYVKFRIKPEVLAQHFNEVSLSHELPYIKSNLTADDLTAVANVKRSLPERLKAHVGSDALRETSSVSSGDFDTRMLDVLEQIMGERPEALNQKAVAKLRDHFRPGV